MKSKKVDNPFSISERSLKHRLWRAFIVGILFFGFVVWGFIHIRNAPESDGISSFLRKSFYFNETVWSKLHSDQRMSPNIPESRSGKPPRVNGDIGLNDPVDLAKYRVTIESGDQKLDLPLSAFQALPKVGYSTLFKCIEGWSETIQYGGARFSDFMETYHVGKKTDGSLYHYVGLKTPDEKYYVSIDIDSMLHPQTVLAYEMNDQALSPANGAPLRLIIPMKYGIKNLKRIGSIYFSDTRPPDYWAEQGYDWWSGL